MSGRCSFIKASGERCKGTVTGQHGLCWHHAPENAERRRRTASKAGRAKADSEVRALKEEIKALIADVKNGEMDRADAAVMLQGYRALKEYIVLEDDRQILPELAERIRELENERGKAVG